MNNNANDILNTAAKSSQVSVSRNGGYAEIDRATAYGINTVVVEFDPSTGDVERATLLVAGLEENRNARQYGGNLHAAMVALVSN